MLDLCEKALKKNKIQFCRYVIENIFVFFLKRKVNKNKIVSMDQ